MQDAYGFVSVRGGAVGEFLETVSGVSGFRFGSRVVGSHDAFVAFDVPDLVVLQDEIVPAVQAAEGVRHVSWSTTSPPPPAPKDPSAATGFVHPFNTPKHYRLAYTALVRVLTASPQAVLATAAARLGEYASPGADSELAVAAAQVHGGEYSVLIDLGATNALGLHGLLTQTEDLPTATALDVALMHLAGGQGS